MAQHFEQPPNASEPRSQRMTADESRAVIALWQQEQVEQTGLTDKPAVPDVAEGLDITVEDVQRLLQDVRAKRIEEQRALATERQFTEIQRQRAELQREQAELERRRMSSQQPLPRYMPIEDSPNELLRGFLPGFVAITATLLLLYLMLSLSGPRLP